VHLALIVSVPLFLAAGWWQVHRAEGGNTLSYAYAVEWPLFAVIAVYLWWQLLHMEPGSRRDIERDSDPDGGGVLLGRRREQETPELAAYNDDLELLAAVGRPKTWRNPRGMP